MGLLVYFTFALTIFYTFPGGGCNFLKGVHISLRGVRTPPPLNPALRCPASGETTVQTFYYSITCFGSSNCSILLRNLQFPEEKLSKARDRETVDVKVADSVET